MIEHIPPAQLADWAQHAQAENGHPPLLLDVREPLEWQLASVHPPGLELLQLPMYSIPAHLPQLNPERPTAVLCHHGGRSLQVAHYLLQNGFDRVANISGGIDAWSTTLDPALPRY